ncbi:MAG: hypothetical protein GF335_02220 [Candidatus Moranbacteria bacterium]|nr:hypothetical protein [Candidatus Moranbacteria bacterium]
MNWLINNKKSFLIFVILFAAVGFCLLLNFVKAQSTDLQETSSTQQEDETDQEEIEKQIRKKRKQLIESQKKKQGYQSKADYLGAKSQSLQKVIGDLDQEIKLTQQSIEATEENLKLTQQEIQIKHGQILHLEDILTQKRKILAEYVKILNNEANKSALEVMLSSKDLADYFSQLNSINETSKSIKRIYDEIKADKDKLVKQKKDLEQKRESQNQLRAMQNQQKQYLNNKKEQKDKLLAATQGEEEKFRQLMEKEQDAISRISSELTALQSHGVAIEFEDALMAARYASSLTKVRTAYLLGILRVESNMGNNVGGGYYKVDMRPSQHEIFELICEELGYEAEDMPVSKKPCYRDDEGNCTGWGGAMGPAQFMPTTWLGYKDQVKAITGQTANPWNLNHALVAMALKVAKIDGVTDHDREAEFKAANIYLAGSNWENYTWYGDRVLKYADAFEQKIKQEDL